MRHVQTGALVAIALLCVSAIAYAQGLMTFGAGSVSSLTAAPPPACGTGVIDASAGCALPMLGM